ncbi:ParA family protein [Rothia terrae]|uniref:ParA family protein n=1 Tax=Rothia terrae TaxID=396015 RepID=UPI0014483F2E|nr:ParA family protein [Rothia terrae]MDT0190295.1 ParA family protein [Rothia terrae]NKZ34691.1 ParA family protein [Rothia terrae]
MTTTISISSLKGGVGKTSVTLGLASAALAQGKRVLVIDLDPHADSSTGLAVDTRTACDVGTALLDKNISFDKALSTSAWGRVPLPEGADIKVLRGSAMSSRFDALTYKQTLYLLSQKLESIKEDFDLILIDCPPTLSRLTATAWAASDRVISIAEPTLFSVAGTERTLRAIAQFEANSPYRVESASIVVNRYNRNSPEHRFRMDELRDTYGDLVAHTVLPETPEVQSAHGAAFPLHFWRKSDLSEHAQLYTRLLAGLLAEAQPTVSTETATTER